MAKKQENHDADYDRWGSAPGAIKVIKPKKKGTAKPKGKGKK